MRKNLFYFLFGFTLIAGFVSCKKSSDFSRRTTPTNPPPGVTNPDEQASTAFNSSMQVTIDNSISEVFKEAYQSTDEFRVLADASAVILQRAGLLNEYMNELNIAHHNDARLILAAKIINDLYVEGPPPIDNINSGYLWKCLLSTPGVPAEAVVDVMKGRTMAEIGTIVKAMGSGWLIEQLVKVGQEAVTGWGTGLGIADISMCMLFDDQQLAAIIDAPNFQWPADSYITYGSDKFYIYIVSALQWYKANNGSANWPVFTPYEIAALCDSFKTSTLSGYPYPNSQYAGFYLCAEPGFMSQLTDFIYSSEFEMPDIE